MLTSRWRALAYSGAILCSYILFLIITLPAYWADWLVNRAGLGAVRIQQSEGTLWNGSGDLVIQGTGRERMQSRIVWELQPLWLFTGKLQVRLSSQNSDPALNAKIRVGYHHLSIQEVEARLPVGVIGLFNPAFALMDPTGRLQITTPEMTLTTAGLEGGMQLTWLAAGTRLGGLSEIGDYRLVVNGRGPKAEFQIETLRGDVGITAQGEWQTQGDGLLHLTGTISPGSREPALIPLLRTLNAQKNGGQYTWTLDNRFPVARLFGN
jgi:general secretion pathway protein N